jgi:predicted DNA-binding protein YlxM (UPF0122 family)
MFEKDLSLALLYDLYAPLISEKKKAVFEAYYLSDLSLAEIAQETGTSRQAVRDLIVRTSKELKEYEEKMGLCKKQKQLLSYCDALEHSQGDGKLWIDRIRQIL